MIIAGIPEHYHLALMHQVQLWANKLSPEKKTEPIKYIIKYSFKYCMTIFNSQRNHLFFIQLELIIYCNNHLTI